MRAWQQHGRGGREGGEERACGPVGSRETTGRRAHVLCDAEDTTCNMAPCMPALNRTSPMRTRGISHTPTKVRHPECDVVHLVCTGHTV